MRLLVVTLMTIPSMLLISSCTPGDSSPAPSATALNPPLYPGAQQVDVKKTQTTIGPKQEITFHTDDEPQAVLDYYKDTLEKDGWRYRDDLSMSGGYSYFSWGNSTAGAYIFTVEAKSDPKDQTNVELQVQIDKVIR